jgi:hypothetical protein
VPAREVKGKPPATGEDLSRETLKKGVVPDQICTTDERLIQGGLAQPDGLSKEARLHAISERDKKASPTAATGTDWTKLYDDLRSAIQKLPGHSNVRTTMISIHTVRSRTLNLSVCPHSLNGDIRYQVSQNIPGINR